MNEPGLWYYTLSAIPQTLAAMIALVATFVVYKLSRVSDRIEKERGLVKSFLLHLHPEKEIHHIEGMRGEELLEALQEGIAKLDPEEKDLGFSSFKKLEALLKDIIEAWHLRTGASGQRIYDFLRQKENIFRNLVHTRKLAIKLLVACLFLTAVPTCVSLLALPNIEYFTANLLPIAFALAGFASISILVTAYSVWKIAKL
ncbi:MAG: hypothetical protein G01um101419_719 [Parcubacteria group bacterium Gr01-1014_19]|nr:MAG: hypothetical protein G01um101419_719 [Parcubacteria group bacterium Gr01-1014_19]